MTTTIAAKERKLCVLLEIKPGKLEKALAILLSMMSAKIEGVDPGFAEGCGEMGSWKVTVTCARQEDGGEMIHSAVATFQSMDFLTAPPVWAET